MHKDFVPPVSIEEFAAYLDGNLSEDGMNRIDALAAMNHDMEEMNNRIFFSKQAENIST